MKYVIATTVVGMALILTACSKGTKGVAADGTCTQATIDAFNNINSNAKMFAATGNKQYLQGAASQCAQFDGLIGGDSCKAMDVATSAEKKITKADAKKVCDAVKSVLGTNSKVTPADPIPADPIPEESNSDVELCSQETIDALNVINSDRKKWYEGSIDHLEKASDACATYKKSMGDKSCRALIQTPHYDKVIGPNDYKKTCEAVDVLLQVEKAKAAKNKTADKKAKAKNISDEESELEEALSVELSSVSEIQ
ncbi:hypothetical protein [Bdellovibrio sp. HCB337]|uniref:hypothetical protein n=1 Tax=Bdellovibrio sp. HCB337 TaxID=3394358 RepID=UPI0039A6B8AA